MFESSIFLSLIFAESVKLLIQMALFSPLVMFNMFWGCVSFVASHSIFNDLTVVHNSGTCDASTKNYTRLCLVEDIDHVNDSRYNLFVWGCLRGFERCLRGHLNGICLKENLFDRVKSPPTTVKALPTRNLKLNNAEISKDDINNKMVIRGQLDVTELLFTPVTIQQ